MRRVLTNATVDCINATYGAAAADPTLGRPMLHATVLGFVHASTGEYTEYCAPLPADMDKAVACRRTPVRSVAAGGGR